MNKDKEVKESTYGPYQKAFYLRNRKRLIARQIIYGKLHPEGIARNNKKYAQSHPEKMKAAQKRWVAKNREHLKAYLRDWRLKKKEKEAKKIG